ncbi:MAG TPA: FAD-dependent monooxygenase [Steroidobacteraceae bacterium]|nr:FAD-dependent monooxygenase [Steroidobacteraceae bacterium]
MTALSSAVVVGGGIVGLVSARALALKGIRVVLLERKSVITDEGGIGIGLQSNAMNALAEIGLAHRCLDKGIPVETITVCAPDGSALFSRPTERYCHSPWPGYTGVSRAALHAVLVEGAAQAGAELVTDAEVVGIAQDAKGASAVLSDGRRFSADLLVGADGIHSHVRSIVAPDRTELVPLGEGVWRALIKGVQLHDVCMMFGGPVGTIGYCPLRGDTYLYVVDQNTHAPARDDPALAARLVERIGGVRGFPARLLAHLSHRSGDVTYRPLAVVRLRAPWYSGRVIMIGDAAHAGPPTLAQGAAMGIEDAVVLAQCVVQSDGLTGSLETFMRRRYERVRTIVEASVSISRAQMEAGGERRMAEAQKAAGLTLAQPY